MAALLKGALAAKTSARRFGLARQIQALAARDVPIIPYWQGSILAVGRKNVRGIRGSLDAAFWMRFWQLSKS
jgi:peptide/nickel transport system substrate-binding protein